MNSSQLEVSKVVSTIKRTLQGGVLSPLLLNLVVGVIIMLSTKMVLTLDCL